MKTSFLCRVMRERIVDTQSYRYTYIECRDHAEIRRIHRDLLGTTFALDWSHWDLVTTVYDYSDPDQVFD